MDIRDWALGHENMGKGITLSEGEAEKLAGFYRRLEGVVAREEVLLLLK